MCGVTLAKKNWGHTSLADRATVSPEPRGELSALRRTALPLRFSSGSLKQVNSGFLNYHWSWKCMLASDQNIFKQPAENWLPDGVTLISKSNWTVHAHRQWLCIKEYCPAELLISVPLSHFNEHFLTLDVFCIHSLYFQGHSYLCTKATSLVMCFNPMSSLI